VATTHIVVLALTLVTVLCLPCLVAVLICVDEPFTRWAQRRRGRARRRLDRRLGTDAAVPVPRAEPAMGPSIEHIAADLRRLDRHRTTGIANESLAWLAAVQRAYDDRLRLACERLGVPEHLGDLDGIDRDIERVRVEGSLQQAGLILRTAVDRRPDVY
jgi:hypothetical protein